MTARILPQDLFPADRLPQSVPLAVSVRPEDGEIVDVGPYRHKVRWSDAESAHAYSITYCNNCGSAFMHAGIVKTDKGPLSVMACAECHAFMGLECVRA